MSSRDRGNKLVDALLRRNNDEAIKILQAKGDVDLEIENKGDYAIHLAARRGDVDVIKAMRKKGVDLNQKNIAENVAMHYAAKGGFVELVEYLLQNGCTLNIANEVGETPLHEAVKTQTMDVVEKLVDLGMDPNVRNKEGETPLHTALKFGAVEAMEALLIKKAKPDLTDNSGRKPKDVAKNSAIRESLQMYSTMMAAMQSGNIKAKGLKIKRRDVTQPTKIDRVGIIIESIDIPKEFPTGFYCRREKTENSSVPLPKPEEESVFSDVFHIRIFEVNRDCPTKILLPVYRAPSDKEQMVIRNVYQNDMTVVDTVEIRNKMNYCLLETKLVPETTCTCVIYVRPKKEEKKITEEGSVITSEMEKDFSLDVPAGSFEGETVLSLTVFETNTEEYVGTDDEYEEDDDIPKSKTKDSADKTKVQLPPENPDITADSEQTPLSAGGGEVDQAENTEKESKSETAKKKSNLVTDVYQINLSGDQPKKGITVQIPLLKGMSPDDDIAIVHADENNLGEGDNLEILPTQPKIVNMNLVFEVTQFCIYVASWKKKVASKEERIELQRQISMTRDKRKPASLFAVIRQVEGLRHVMVVECVVANKSEDRRKRWADKENYEIQNPPEAGSIMMTPGDTFYVNVEGNAYLEDINDSTNRKLQFSQVRSSWQAYHVLLKENIYDAEKAIGYVVISKKTDSVLEESARLRIKLTAPPRPPTPPPSKPTSQAAVNRFKDATKPSYKPEKSIEDRFKSPFAKMKSKVAPDKDSRVSSKASSRPDSRKSTGSYKPPLTPGQKEIKKKEKGWKQH
ncbi:hypothetical protein ACF0H5_013036 [Mactra antiquata]